MRHFQGQVGAWIGIGICFFLLVGTIAARTATEGSLAASAGEQMTTDLYQQAAKIFLPAAFYEQEDESAVSWLLGQMQHVLPVYAYMGERRQTAQTRRQTLREPRRPKQLPCRRRSILNCRTSSAIPTSCQIIRERPSF